MVCKQCGSDAIKNTALGKSFYYCRTCKIEIDPEMLVIKSFDSTKHLKDMTPEELENILKDFRIPSVTSDDDDDTWDLVNQIYHY